MTFYDADGCVVVPGNTTWIPWRWAHWYAMWGNRVAREAGRRCRLHGQKSLLREPEGGERVSSVWEIVHELPPGKRP